LSAISKAELRLPVPFELPPFSLGGGGRRVDILIRLPVKYKKFVFIEASRKIKSTFRDIDNTKKFKNHWRLYKKN
jgi:hypothetical protein